MRSVVIIAVVALSTLMMLTVDAKYVSYTKCTDKRDCSTGCTSNTLPTDSCLPTDNANISQYLICVPVAETCFVNKIYSDSNCENQVASQVVPCGQCFPPNVNRSGWEQLNCFVGDNNDVSLNLNKCPPGTDNDKNCNCLSKASTIVNVPAGKCVPNNGQYGSLQKLSTCAAVVQILFGTADCSGAPVAQTRIATNSCNMGEKFTCHGDW